jgi:A/G-specific adenine glycosylase
MRSDNFSKQLIQWFEKNKRNLPWRKTRDPYKIWISEVMLQQTTVSTVIPYYKKWVRRFPTVQSLANAQLKTVLKWWQGLGYYSRARNLHKAAKVLVKDFNGKIPFMRAELQSLPGLGPYTTGAVLSIAFGQREPIVDANVRRVIMRFLALKGFANPTQDKMILHFLEQVMPRSNMSAFNQGLMELGALVCRSGQALCLQCPLRSFCKAYAKGIQEIIPRAEQKQLERKDVAVAIIKNKNKFFIQKRPSGGLLGDLWEFPGGQKEKNESLKDALAREVSEEIGAKVISSKLFFEVKHFYTRFCVYLYAFECKISPLPKSDRTHKWLSLKGLKNYPVPSGTARIVDRLSFTQRSSL